jgi:hypothetical protein
MVGPGISPLKATTRHRQISSDVPMRLARIELDGHGRGGCCLLGLHHCSCGSRWRSMAMTGTGCCRERRRFPPTRRPVFWEWWPYRPRARIGRVSRFSVDI